MDVSGTIGAVLNQKSREIYSVSPDATVFEAVQLMDAKNVGALLVMDGQRLVGVISERDYTRKISSAASVPARPKSQKSCRRMCSHASARARRDMSATNDRQPHSPFAGALRMTRWSA